MYKRQVSETLGYFVVAAVLAYEGWRVTAGPAVGLGGFVSFFAALLMASQALRQVSNLTTVLSQGMVAGRRLFAALDVEPEVRETPGAPDLTLSQATIRFEDVLSLIHI